MTTSLTFSDSILIAATPQQVYSTVADVTRTGEWSPVCKECWWDEGDSAQIGAHFTGRNVNSERTWETRSEVTAADPGVKFSWKVAGGTANWSYEMEESDGGTKLTESWEFTPFGQGFFQERFGDQAPVEVEKRRVAAETGIPVTLANIKKIVEQEA
ncbi:SRPBCC family protein [Corynebacterium lubricantis]|uniref:SRPBCC family protein n=1 Tax=Corynebacterium lubricantis TaxID=541095 RepID=UPI0003675F4B|nr:SRPBCC family protein [Corynebacterium lubricantis]